MRSMGYLDKEVSRAELKSFIEEIINEKIPTTYNTNFK